MIVFPSSFNLIYQSQNKIYMRRIRTIIFLVVVCLCQPILAAGDKTTLSGTVTDALDGSPLPGVAVYLPELKIGAMTRDDGTYEINNLPRKKTVIQVTYLGHQTIIETVDLAVVSVKDFVMQEDNAMLNEVVLIGFTGNSLVSQTPAPVTVSEDPAPDDSAAAAPQGYDHTACGICRFGA